MLHSVYILACFSSVWLILQFRISILFPKALGFAAHVPRLHLAMKSLFYTRVCTCSHSLISVTAHFFADNWVLQCDTRLSLCPEKQPNLQHDRRTTSPQLEVLCHPRACHFIHETKICSGHRASGSGLGMNLTVSLSLILLVCGTGQRHSPPRGVGGFTHTGS